jgi:hypothetical protein
MQELTTAQQRNAELRRRNAELQQALTQQMAPDNPSLLAAQSVTGPGLQLPVDRTGSPAEGTDEDGPAADEEEKHLLSHQQERLHDLARSFSPKVKILNSPADDTLHVVPSMLDCGNLYCVCMQELLLKWAHMFHLHDWKKING